MKMKVAVVTPTIGSKHLTKCIDSVDKQTYPDVLHYVFIDGREHRSKVKSQVMGAAKLRFIDLEDNVGKGWYGHRVYAACSFLVNADIIIYLDEDNWLEPDHVEKMVKKINEGYDWVYSLRKIVDGEGKFLCEDNCESLGKWPVFFDKNVHHIDTSCFAIRRDVAVRIGHAWYGQWGADRQFYKAISTHFPNYSCTNEHTVNYRLDGNENSVKAEFFESGNAINKANYNGNFPWKMNSVSHWSPVPQVISVRTSANA
jgi:glycosyltransferase involved in cell wall biosynthesis